MTDPKTLPFDRRTASVLRRKAMLLAVEELQRRCEHVRLTPDCRTCRADLNDAIERYQEAAERVP